MHVFECHGPVNALRHRHTPLHGYWPNHEPNPKPKLEPEPKP